jgi:hypothetical protein
VPKLKIHGGVLLHGMFLIKQSDSFIFIYSTIIWSDTLSAASTSKSLIVLTLLKAVYKSHMKFQHYTLYAFYLHVTENNITT